MRFLIRSLCILSLGSVVFAAFNNFSPVEGAPSLSKALASLPSELKGAAAEEESAAKPAAAVEAPAKDYIEIDGKLYERNARNIYMVDGVPTFAGGPRRKIPAPTTAKVSPKPSNVGPAIDPSIYKDAMGLDADDEFFKPKTGEASID